MWGICVHVNDVADRQKGETQVEQFCILAFLGINSLKDLRTREVSMLTIGIFAFGGVIRACLMGNICMEWAAAICLGAAMIALSVMTKGAVGMGDGFIMMALGTVLSFRELLEAFLLGLVCCSVGGIILLFLPGTRKKTEIPFVPFLLLGYIGGLIY